MLFWVDFELPRFLRSRPPLGRNTVDRQGQGGFGKWMGKVNVFALNRERRWLMDGMSILWVVNKYWGWEINVFGSGAKIGSTTVEVEIGVT